MFLSYLLHVSIVGFFYYSPKNEFVVEVRSLKVTARYLNNAGCCYEYTIVSMTRIARRYTIQCSLPSTHTVHIELDGGRQAGRQGRMADGREGARGGQGTRGREGEREGEMERAMDGGSEGREGGSDDDMQGESVSGGREGRGREGCERGRDGPRHGRREGKRGGRKRAEEGLSEEGMEQLREQGRETSR